MIYFESCKTLDELKAEYRRLAKLNHPDNGGDTATMQAVNRDYTEAFERLKAQHNATHDEAHQTTEAPEEFIEIISALIRIPGITVELCGAWLWIGGETRAHKDELKAAGCRWSSKKMLWYWRHAEDAAYHRGHTKSMDYIRATYGSQVFAASRLDQIEATA